jgi:hypothetical protein
VNWYETNFTPSAEILSNNSLLSILSSYQNKNRSIIELKKIKSGRYETKIILKSCHDPSGGNPGVFTEDNAYSSTGMAKESTNYSKNE